VSTVTKGAQPLCGQMKATNLLCYSVYRPIHNKGLNGLTVTHATRATQLNGP